MGTWPVTVIDRTGREGATPSPPGTPETAALLGSLDVSKPLEGGAAVTPRGGSRNLCALLDSLFPGFGHLVAGRRRRARSRAARRS